MTSFYTGGPGVTADESVIVDRAESAAAASEGYRDEAQGHANAAALDQSNAKTEADRSAAAAVQSEDARDASQGYRDEAQGHASTASTEAGNAATSATTAQGHASTASTSASNAATSAGQANTSASNASASASAALTSESNAATSAASASTSESNASTSASNAAVSESNAAASLAAINAEGYVKADGTTAMTGTQVINALNVGTEWSPTSPGSKARMIQFGHTDYMGFIPRVSDDSGWDWGQRLCYGTGERGDRAWFLGDEGVSANRIVTRGYSGLFAPGAYWRDMTASRTALVTYTNTTGHVMAVSVRAIDDAGTLRNCYAAIGVNGVTISETSAIDRNSASQYASVFALVPAGSTYFVNYVGPSGPRVMEFRV